MKKLFLLMLVLSGLSAHAMKKANKNEQDFLGKKREFSTEPKKEGDVNPKERETFEEEKKETEDVKSRKREDELTDRPEKKQDKVIKQHESDLELTEMMASISSPKPSGTVSVKEAFSVLSELEDKVIKKLKIVHSPFSLEFRGATVAGHPIKAADLLTYTSQFPPQLVQIAGLYEGSDNRWNYHTFLSQADLTEDKAPRYATLFRLMFDFNSMLDLSGQKELTHDKIDGILKFLKHSPSIQSLSFGGAKLGGKEVTADSLVAHTANFPASLKRIDGPWDRKNPLTFNMNFETIYVQNGLYRAFLPYVMDRQWDFRDRALSVQEDIEGFLVKLALLLRQDPNLSIESIDWRGARHRSGDPLVLKELVECTENFPATCKMDIGDSIRLPYGNEPDSDRNGFHSENVALYAKFLSRMPHLRKLDLRGQKLGGQGAKVLATLLQEVLKANPLSNLRELDLHGNCLRYLSMKDTELKTLSFIGDKIPHLQVLHLGDNNFYGDVAEQEMSDFITKLPDLRGLHLDTNGFIVDKLAAGLKALVNLEELNLSDNNLAFGMDRRPFFEALSEMKNLRKLDLSHNDMGFKEYTTNGIIVFRDTLATLATLGLYWIVRPDGWVTPISDSEGEIRKAFTGRHVDVLF